MSVPYQPYKSKRHSKHLSGSNLTNGIPPNPNGALTTIPAEPSDLSLKSTPPEPDPEAHPSEPISVPTLPTVNGSATNGIVAASESRQSSESVTLNDGTKVSSSPTPPVIRVQSELVISEAIASSSNDTSPRPGPSAASSSSAVPTTSAPSTLRKTSTFRRVPRNTPSSRPVSMSSAMDLPRNPTTSSRPNSLLLSPSQAPRLNTNPITPSPLARDSTRQSSPSPTQSPQSPHAIESLPAPQPQHPPTVISPHHRTSSLPISSSPSISAPTPTSVPLPPSQSQSPAYSLGVSRPTSARSPSRTPPSHRQVTPTPYRPGFQPKGVYRPRTDDFLSLRRLARDGPESDSSKRIERTKLERRLEKLIALHFPEPGEPSLEKGSGNETGTKELLRPQITPKQRSERRRTSSFFDMSMDDIRKSVGDNLLRSVLSPSNSTSTASRKSDIRNAEQRITPWEEDADVSKCRICLASFHPITNRKHHCRLCGRIICSLPATPGYVVVPGKEGKGRAVPCSSLFVVEGPRGQRRIEEVGEGVDYGVRRRRTVSMNSGGGSSVKGNGTRVEEEEEEEKFLKGVRICRDCRPVLLRQQYLREMSIIPMFARLYDAFISLEKELEDSLPQFQELILSLNKDLGTISPQSIPTHEANVARKRLLDLFAQYDALSKRIRSLPCKPGSSQDRIQLAVMTRANVFLQQHMFPLQAIPKQSSNSKTDSEKERTGKGGKGKEGGAGGEGEDEGTIINGTKLDPPSELSMKLQPLLEQELLLESFVEEATAHRKFEDAKTLRRNLGEIRAEIEKIVRESEVELVGKRGGTARR